MCDGWYVFISMIIRIVVSVKYVVLIYVVGSMCIWYSSVGVVVSVCSMIVSGNMVSWLVCMLCYISIDNVSCIVNVV